MRNHTEPVCVWCSTALTPGESFIIEGHQFHSEACYRSWDRLWGRLSVVVWVSGIVYIVLFFALSEL